MNMLSPVILAFFVGAVISLVRPGTQLPKVVMKALSCYLLVAIGFEGGVKLAASGLTSQVLTTAAVGVGFGLLFPVLGFVVLRRITDEVNAAAISAHYGSVSAVTFVTAAAFLTGLGVLYEPFMVGMMAIMEAPAILAGVFLAHRYGRMASEVGPESRSSYALGISAFSAGPSRGVNGALLKEVFLGSSVLLLVGSLLVGAAAGEPGLLAVKAVLVEPFKAILALFLFGMGLVVGQGMKEFRRLGLPLTLFGLAMPLFGGTLGAIAGALLGLSLGGTTLLAVLSGSASYIAVPAAMKLALPQANPSLSLTMALGVTFPFNVTVGIPLFYHLSRLTTGIVG